MRNRQKTRRRGAALVLLLVAVITLFAFVALAIDLGMLAVARTQLQDAVDVAAMAGARTLNGDMSANNNYGSAAPNAIAAAEDNSVLSKPIAASQVNVQIGRYVYMPGPKQFEGQFPGPSNENWSMVMAQITANMTTSLAFAKVFNVGSTNMQASATAVHRPRDVAVILDYSGSMRFGSLTGLSSGSSAYSGSRTQSNNPDPVFPQFGHYSNVASAGLQATSFNSPYDPANITTTTSDGRPPVVLDFYRDNGGTLAFTPASTAFATTPGGDNYLKSAQNTSANWAADVEDVVGSTSFNNTFETQGYQAYTGVPFAGYTQGPGYWGKSFFVWPPNPQNDWRVGYFGTNNNTNLWNSSGHWRAPSGSTYQINYSAILNFIKNVGPQVFPPRLQSGRILYYDQIPNSISSTWPPSDLNQRFWKDYIDYVVGVIQSPGNDWDVITDGSTGYAGYGPDYTWGTVRINPKPSFPDTRYMDYLDNPRRPRTHFWFGPLTMLDFLGNYGMWYHPEVSPDASRFCWWPGTCHESPMYACKLGVRAALNDIETNHPNNLVSLMMFSHPRGSVNDDGRFNRPRVGLSRNYSRMQESLWYPPSTLGSAGATVRPYDSDNLDVPRAFGGTCYAMGLMQAYNQFSGNTSLVTYNSVEPPGDAGGNGRRGAQKVIIFETDGMPNTAASASLSNLGSHNSYYRVRYNSASPGGSEYPSVSSPSYSSVASQIYSLCNQICALETANPPGYSTASKKALIHCIGFGPVFAPGSSDRAAALDVLTQMQLIGNVDDGMPSYKVIYGTEDAMVAKLQQAFTQILQNGVQVSLLH
jgi:hypothetical protein